MKEGETLKPIIYRKSIIGQFLTSKKLIIWLSITTVALYFNFYNFNQGVWYQKLFLTLMSGLLLISAIMLTYYLIKFIFCWSFSYIAIRKQTIIATQQIGFFNKNVKEIGLESIQNVNYLQAGILNTLFNIGEIEIQTTSGNGEISIKNIANPRNTQQALLSLIREEK